MISNDPSRSPGQCRRLASSRPLPGRPRIFLVDDHPLVIKGLDKLIRGQPWTVCGTATDDLQALRQISCLQPDLAIVGLDLNGHSGLELIRKLRSRRFRLRTLVFSRHDECLYAGRALRAGASGYVMKHEPTEVLAGAIREVLSGGTFLSARLKMSSARSSCPPGPFVPLRERLQRLTNRELHVFRLIGLGKSTLEIARLLGVSIKTVGSHRSNMMAKLGIDNASLLVRQAIGLNHEHFSSDLAPVHTGDAPGNVLIQVGPSYGSGSSAEMREAVCQ